MKNLNTLTPSLRDSASIEGRAPLATYQRLCTESYDLAHHPHNARALSFYLDCARAAQGPVLEPMCGTGRLLLPILYEHIDIEGFDASPYMLQALKAKEPNAPVWEQFVQDFKSDRRYALIFVPYGSWGLISDIREARKSLKIMYDHLEAGGKFIADIETIASTPISNEWQKDYVTRADGSQIRLNTYATFNAQTQVFNALCRYELITNSVIESTEIEDFRMYLYRFSEFEQYAKEAGFRIIRKYQDYNKIPATDLRAPLIIYECIK